MSHVLVNSRILGGHISITNGIVFENSLDLDRGRRPELKSDEFLKTIPIVIEIISILLEIAGRSSCTLWEPDPAATKVCRADSSVVSLCTFKELTFDVFVCSV